ncbi:unnamed protein product, partial [Allacma fusca]
LGKRRLLKATGYNSDETRSAGIPLSVRNHRTTRNYRCKSFLYELLKYARSRKSNVSIIRAHSSNHSTRNLPKASL